MKYIYSTLTGSQEYVQWARGKNEMSRKVGSILIKGGANLPPKTLVTPRGVLTALSDEDHDLICKSHVFQTHLKGGFIVVEDKPAESPDQVASDMTSRDHSAPLTSQDFTEAGRNPPTYGPEVPGSDSEIPRESKKKKRHK